jgi:hypothetical protein
MLAYKLITTKKYLRQLLRCRTKVGVLILIKLLDMVQMSNTTYYLKRVTNFAHAQRFEEVASQERWRSIIKN